MVLTMFTMFFEEHLSTITKLQIEEGGRTVFTTHRRYYNCFPSPYLLIFMEQFSKLDIPLLMIPFQRRNLREEKVSRIETMLL